MSSKTSLDLDALEEGNFFFYLAYWQTSHGLVLELHENERMHFMEYIDNRLW